MGFVGGDRLTICWGSSARGIPGHQIKVASTFRSDFMSLVQSPPCLDCTCQLPCVNAGVLGLPAVTEFLEYFLFQAMLQATASTWQTRDQVWFSKQHTQLQGQVVAQRRGQLILKKRWKRRGFKKNARNQPSDRSRGLGHASSRPLTFFYYCMSQDSGRLPYPHFTSRRWIGFNLAQSPLQRLPETLCARINNHQETCSPAIWCELLLPRQSSSSNQFFMHAKTQGQFCGFYQIYET